MSRTRDQRALFYDLVLGFRGKYSCKAEMVAAPSVNTASKDGVGFRRSVLLHLHVVATGKRSLQSVESKAKHLWDWMVHRITGAGSRDNKNPEVS